ncbi:permease prefix domain 1-containing protein [Nonomuraea sp. B12E4]|uniref:permease prefix domain 1-containing protein n=1 Tax=Nonomuraea sp. B12E4 TaxID=3153564 RepID=UPI00325E5BA0
MLIDDYVADLHRCLAGPHGPKRDMVVEARDSLTDTADALEAGGLDRAEAERLAVAEFGEVAEIAPEYQAELTAASGRRLGALLFLGVPVITVMWSALWSLYPATEDVWMNRPDWYSVVSRSLDILQLCVGLYGGIALFALSRGGRWIRRPRLITRSLGVIVWAMLPITVVMGLVLSFGMGSPNTLTPLPAVLANLVGAAMWGMQIYCATRCLRVTRPSPRRD